MKISSCVTAVLLLLSLAATGCKSATVEDAFHKTHDKEGTQILHQGTAAEKTFIIYKNPYDNGAEGVGMAVFEGSDTDGWEMAASQSICCKSEVLMDFLGITFDDGVRRHFIYGTTDNPTVNRIQFTDINNMIIQAQFITTNWKRVWYAVVQMNELKMQVYDNNNHNVMEVPYKK